MTDFKLDTKVSVDEVELDASQLEALAVFSQTGRLIAEGAPGSGLTTVAQQALVHPLKADVLSGWVKDPEALRPPVLVVASRAQALEFMQSTRDLLDSQSLSARPVVTPAALAFSVLRAWYVEREDPLPAPSLITGAQFDAILEDLLDTVPVVWPEDIPEGVRSSKHFRTEARLLLEAAAQSRLTDADLARLGGETQRPEWAAMAEVAKYVDVANSEIRRLRALLDGSVDECASAEELWRSLSAERDFAVENLGNRREGLQLIAPSAMVLAAFLLEYWQDLAPLEGVKAVLPTWSRIVIDGAQEFSDAALEFLCQATKRVPVLVTNSPVQSTAAYRGAEVTSSAKLAQKFGAQQVVLEEQHRLRPGASVLMKEVVNKVGDQISLPGSDEAAKPSSTEDLEIHVFASPLQEATWISQRIRRAHLEENVSYGEIAVILRSRNSVTELYNQLQARGIPVEMPTSAVLLSAHPVSSDILRLLDGSITVNELLVSPLVGMDPMMVSKVRRTLAKEWQVYPAYQEFGELEQTAHLDSADWRAVRTGLTEVTDFEIALEKMLNDPELVQCYLNYCQGRLGSYGFPELKVAAQLWKFAEQGRLMSPRLALSQLWEIAGKAKKWREKAIAGHFWADDNLDVVTALLRTADLWEQNNPGLNAAQFATQYLQQGIESTNLARGGYRGPAVVVMTAAASVGREWKYVFLSHFAEGEWPSLAIRDHILGVSDLNSVARYGSQYRSDPDTRRRNVLNDELRMFTCASTRASEKLILTATSDEDNSPSLLIGALDTLEGKVSRTQDESIELDGVPPAFDMRGTTARLRRELLKSDCSEEQTEAYVALLALIAAAQTKLAEQSGLNKRMSDPITDLAGQCANPRFWPEAYELSSTEPIIPEDSEVYISPSRVDTVKKCALTWFTYAAASEPAGEAQELGTFIHSLAEKYPTLAAAQVSNAEQLHEKMVAELEKVWPNLGEARGTVAGDADWQEAVRKLGLLAKYLANSPHQVHTEYVVDAQVGRAHIHGSVDRLEEAEDGSVTVVDLKTGNSQPTKQEALEHGQLLTYQVALREMGWEVKGAKLVYTGKNKSCSEKEQNPLVSDPEDQPANLSDPRPIAEIELIPEGAKSVALNDAKELIASVAEVMSGNHFKACGDSKCRVCSSHLYTNLNTQSKGVIS